MQLDIKDVKPGMFVYQYLPKYDDSGKVGTFWDSAVSLYYIHKAENHEPFWTRDVRGYFSNAYSDNWCRWQYGEWHSLVPILELNFKDGGKIYQRIPNKQTFINLSKKISEDGGFLYEYGDYTQFYPASNISHTNYLDIEVQRGTIHQNNWQSIYLLNT